MFLDVWTIRAAFRADGIQATLPVEFNPPKTLH
jgi:hypothetical protein